MGNKNIILVIILIIIILFVFFFISRPGKECNIWSLGILLFVLIEMHYPYQSFYKQRQRSYEIRREIKEGLLEDGKVFFFFSNAFLFLFFYMNRCYYLDL
jgi:serine/threonine protein kinase